MIDCLVLLEFGRSTFTLTTGWTIFIAPANKIPNGPVEYDEDSDSTEKPSYSRMAHI